MLQLAATVDVEVLLTLNDTATPGEILLQGKVGTLSLKLKVVVRALARLRAAKRSAHADMQSSTIGNVNTVIINTALTTLLNTIVKPAVNKALSSGIPLPIPAGVFALLVCSFIVVEEEQQQQQAVRPL